MISAARFSDVTRRRPECDAWAALLAEAFDETLTGRCAQMMMTARAPAPASEGAPLLAGAALSVNADTLEHYVQRLLTKAARGRRVQTRPPTLGTTAVFSFLEAALAQDENGMTGVAESSGMDGDLLRALAPIAVLPLLQGYRRAWGHQVSPHWARRFCPVCGAWPALAEVRGLERTRRFRCLRCASDWHAGWLACPYCDNREHTQLGSLVVADTTEARKADICKRCLGYLKSVTTLQASDPAELAAVDMETMELDIVAVGHGYHRPPGLGYPLHVRLGPAQRRRLFGWRR